MNGASSMTNVISIALAQLNSHLGNIDANVARLLDARRDAAAVGAEIVVTPEMYLSGYPSDDLVLRSDFMDEVAAGLSHLPRRRLTAGLPSSSVRRMLRTGSSQTPCSLSITVP